MPYALLSVSDKTGIAQFAGELVERGWQILSTGGTAQALRAAAIPVTPIAEFTGFPEILGGRVKTLHPKIHAGLLARMSVPRDTEELERHGLSRIELVAVNLYPFRETVARADTTLALALDQIDIGGPTMLRAAAKNHAFVWPVCDPSDYGQVVRALDSAGEIERVVDGSQGETGLRRNLAAKVFSHTAAYDAAVGGYLRSQSPNGSLDLPAEMLVSLVRTATLRYGENPDQRGAFYRDASSAPFGIPALQQLHGKELSYNNLLDIDGALLAIRPYLGSNLTACAIMKHTTPCGLALGKVPAEAYRKALACDPLSAFGSVIAFSRPVTEAAAEEVADLFVECVVAPGYAKGALRILQAKKNLRILQPADGTLGEPAGHVRAGLDARGVAGGLLVQESPSTPGPDMFRAAGEVQVATQRTPTADEWTDLAFAWSAVRSVKSNAIVLVSGEATIGIGAGQMSRVDAVQLAVKKAGQAGLEVEGSVLASDAFFPFADGLAAAADAGVAAVVQPGGSVRDTEVTEAADEHGMAMVFTGRRTFRH
ncbi:MAG: bifunctional phosphoribosylaminoimidazolecarboxamide formyltransferase/IMP cyclohydrolase [Gemmatimonadota bacterium]